MAVKSKISLPKRANPKLIKGSSGFKVAKKFSWKKAALFIIPIAIIGGFFVFKSSAYTEEWIPGGQQGSSGTLSTSGGSYKVKSNGTRYWYSGVSSQSSITLTTNRLYPSSVYCVEWDGYGTPSFNFSNPQDSDGVEGYPIDNTFNSYCAFTSSTIASSSSRLTISVRNNRNSNGTYTGVSLWRFYVDIDESTPKPITCSLSLTHTTATWTSVGASSGGYIATLTRVGSNNPPTTGLPVSGSRTIVPPSGTYTYTITIHTSLNTPVASCSKNITK